MAQHNLPADGWTFSWMKRARTLGLCKYRTRQILLSESYVDLNDVDHVEQTILHEIAHALTPGARHGAEWVAKARELGVRNPKSKCQANIEKGRWRALCVNCGKLYDRHRRPKYAHHPNAYYCPCRSVRDHLNVLEFKDVHAQTTHAVSKTLVSAPLGASQTTRAVSVPAATTSSAQSFTAPQLAAAMKVDAKSLRAWLRKHDGMEREYKSTGAWLFPANRVPDIVRAWNATH